MNDPLRRNRLPIPQRPLFQQNHINPRPAELIQYPQPGNATAKYGYVRIKSLLAHPAMLTAETLPV